jgi:hypothetical protein
MKFNEALKAFVKNAEDVTDKEFAEIAKDRDVDKKEVNNFTEFMKTRFAGENLSTAYIREWAERWVKGTGYMYADGPATKILKKLGYKGE